jgi:DNA-binding GntR family transcriptional regulator
LEEICAIRATIEEMAAEWAMAKAHGKLVAELKKNIARAEKVLAAGTVKDFVELDAQFHEIIARLSGSPRLLELAQTLRRHMLRYRVESIYTADNVLRAVSGHKGILAAIEKRDRTAVKKAIAGHLDQSKRDILRYAFKEEASD